MRAVRPSVVPTSTRRWRYKSDQHEQWHRRVEGQIRDCIHMHPRWFVGVTESDRANFTRSLAKRIVGEILAGGSGCTASQAARVESYVEPRRERASWVLLLWRSAAGVARNCVRR